MKQIEGQEGTLEFILDLYSEPGAKIYLIVTASYHDNAKAN
jgi:hypothetical protein